MKVTHGMKRRSAKLARRSELVTRDTLVVALDLAKSQSVVMLVRASDKARLGTMRIPTSRAGVVDLVRRARRLQERHRLPRLLLAMEATSHFWKVVAKSADELAVPYVIVQSFALVRAREFDDLTRDKTDQRDAGLIADLVCDLHFTEAQLERGPWAELRLLAEARQDRLIERGSAMQEQRALLELTWPALLEQIPDLAGTHLQATLRLGLTPLEIAALSQAEFSARLQQAYQPRRFLGWMARRIWEAARAAAASDELSAAALRWQQAAERVLAAEHASAALDARMLAAFESTGLGWIRGQLRGLGDVLLVNLFALIGDVRRFDDARCLPKLAGSNPTERSSGEVQAAGGIHRRGRPTLRVLAYQAAICLVRHQADFHARFTALTTRAHRPLLKQQAYVAVANKLLRTLWAMATSGLPYSSARANGRHAEEVAAAA
ncbi:MAG: IS110 family transposase [Candidatus Dormibacteraeota bacterium]|nr:IS110 family transposase [Candidatus Dormibacteraeota bacterium]